MCPGVLSGGVCGARWTQIDAIARVNVPWRPVERRLPCQMNCRKGECSACMAVRGRSVAGRLSSGKSSRERICPGVLSGGVRVARWTQIDAIARADVPCRALEGRLPCQMNCRKVWSRALRAVCGSSVSGRRSSGKSSREWMCPEAMSRGVRVARWTQIDAIARVNVPWSLVERRLPCLVNCRKGECRACTAMRGRSVIFLQTIAREDVPWSLVEWRLPCKMNCSKGECRACTAVCGRSVIFLQTIARADVPWSAVWRGSRCSMDTN